MEEQEIREQIEAHGHPLVDGRKAAFFWFGETAPLLMGDFCGWEHGPAAQLSEKSPGVWSVTLEFRPDTYMEYAFLENGERVADPLNPHTTPDGFGHLNHFFYMPEGAPTPLAASLAGFPRGQVARFSLPTNGYITGSRRTLYLYQPPVEEPVPLWVVWDGPDYLRRANLVNILDNLIARGEICPVALAMIQNGGQNRSLEYMCSDQSLRFVVDNVLPFAASEMNLLDLKEHPGSYGVMGASMGGLMALFTGLRLPDIFGSVLSQSGAFFFDDYEPVVVSLVRYGPVHPLNIWMDAGIYEWLLEPNRRMLALLKERGYQAAYHEFSAGHNYPAWRDDCPAGLRRLLRPS